MKNNLYNDLVLKMKSKEVIFHKGLSDDEINNIESLFQFQFPLELKKFLQTALPILGSFPNWRAALRSEREKKRIDSKLNWPLESILNSVKYSKYWNKHWELNL